MVRTPGRRRSHKLHVPLLVPGSVPRTCILQAIAAHPEARVVFLQGPAGHGKSTTLLQIREERTNAGQSCGWLTLDEADDDPRRLMFHLQELIEDLRSPDGEYVAEPEVPSRLRSRIDWIIDQLLAVEAPVCLFIDEFQNVRNPELQTFFQEWLLSLPTAVTVFIGTRSLSDEGYSTLRASGRALYFNATDLRFSSNETQRFFDSAGASPLDQTELAQIHQRTEGWPAALHLFNLTLHNIDPRESLAAQANFRPRELAEYLAESVTRWQPPEVQEFLLLTSLLDTFSPELCDEVLERGDSEAMLQHLMRSGLFLRPLDADGRLYRYHSLFAECLQEQLRDTQPERIASIHRRAAYWHRDHGAEEQAVRHLLAAGDIASAAEVLDAWADELVSRGQLDTLMRWAERFPESEILAHPSLSIKTAWACTFLRRDTVFESLTPVLLQRAGQGDINRSSDPTVLLAMRAIGADDIPSAAEWVRQVNIEQPDVHGFAAFELGAAANLSAYCWLAEGDLEMAREQIAIAQDFNTRGELSFSYGYTVSMRAILMIIQGQLLDALRLLEITLQETPMHRHESIASAAVVATYVWGLYEAGREEQALRMFEQYRRHIFAAALPDFLAVAVFPIARIHSRAEDNGKAEQLYDEFDLLARSHGWSRLVDAVQWERTRSALIRGDLELAEQIARRITPASDNSPRTFMTYLCCPRVESLRLAFVRGDEISVAARLQQEIHRGRGKTLRSIQLQILQSEWQLMRGDNMAAMRHLRSALQLAAPGRYRQRFQELPAAQLALMQDIHSHSQDRPQGSSPEVRKLLDDAMAGLHPRAPNATSAAAADSDTLSDRETELLSLVATGLPNKAIARRVFVSENTVKFHLKNIFGKLQVRTRVQAVAEGRRRGLLLD